MNIKLSTLAAMIAVIFFAYYYFVYLPASAQISNNAQLDYEYKEYTGPNSTQNTNGVTPLTNNTDSTDNSVEGFGVTPLLDDDNDYIQYESNAAPANAYNPDSSYELAGNVRPDNVIEYDEPVTRL